MSAILKKVADKKKPEVTPVDTRNDEMMVKESLRLPLFIQNPEWHKKTPQERAELEMVHAKGGGRCPSPSKTRRFARHNLTVHLKNLKKVADFKTTYSVKLFPDEIVRYLHTFFDSVVEEVKVVYYNGKIFPFGN